MKYQIIIEIDDEDNVTLETKGIKGPKCVEILKDITNGFGKVKSSQKTKEYYEQDTKQKVKNKNTIVSK